MAPLLPPLVSLRAFEAAARHMSMSLAAEELCVTPGAVSLQIKELEAALGLKLFVRKPRALELTVEGQTYFASLKVAFRMLREATEVVRQTTRARVITVSCTSTIAVQWLVPKLARLEAENPGLDVRISISHRLVDFARDAVDLAIRHGLGRYDGLISERLLDDELTPVAAPAVAAGLSSVEALSGLTLLHDETRDDWRLWLAAVGAERVEASGGPIFTGSNGALDAAKAGLGVALARRSLVASELEEGALVAPFPQGVANALAYFLVYPPQARARTEMETLRHFLLREAGRSISV
ncbi:transcriptional regulator GcvA [Rhizobium sp. C1]|uniref:transcriptional regulator GcvA n=1 Tax=Rhizobium sp. C1 TaxID=1349799 RepID=UPI001E62B524|nr:transcriptional regulator GcvA [Rhizobium sp. C1]MCD2177457.1 transcriptional regulator GcvA [Rhizobium sp. C1]